MVVGDLHLDSNVKGLSRTEEIKEVLYSLRDKFYNENYDCMIQLGDVFTPKNNKIPYYLYILSEWLRGIDHRYVLVGNHDVIDYDYNIVHTPICSQLSISGCINFPMTIWNNDCDYTFLFLPYLLNSFAKKQYSGKSAQDVLNERAENAIEKNKNIIVFSHLNVVGATIGQEQEIPRGSDLYLPECCVESDKVKYIFNGHYHKNQEIGKIHMPGCVIRLDMGEKDNINGYYTLEL